MTDGYDVPDCRCLRETDQALLVAVPEDHADRTNEIWVPKSQLHDDSEVYEAGQIGTLVVTQWLARQKGWL